MKQRHLKKIPQQQSCGIFSFPGRIISGCGASGSALSEIEGKAAFVCGPYVNRRYGSLLRNAGITGIKFGGECSPGNYHRLKTEVREGGFKTLIALGGGKVMDTAKYVKKSLPEIKLINIPTSASTCAAFTSVSVLYSEQGVYMDTLDTACPDVLVFDESYFRELPMPFFAAGLIDTAAKYFESAVYCGFSSDASSYDHFIMETAKKLAEEAVFISLKKWGSPDDKLRLRMAEINIIESGRISCMGSGSVTAGMAHAMAHAMTMSRAAREFLHGEHVAAGLMFQESALKNRENTALIENICATMDMPLFMEDFGIEEDETAGIYDFYMRIMRKEKIFAPESQI